MKLKILKISTKSFILIFSIINITAGFILGALVSLVSMVSPEDEQNGAIGAWAILIFPLLNGILGVLTGLFLTGMFNFISERLGGIELEYETVS